MALQLTGLNERVEPYSEFYGQLIEQMPLLRSGKDKEKFAKIIFDGKLL